LKTVYNDLRLPGKAFGDLSTNDWNKFRDTLKTALEADGYPVDENFSANTTARLSLLGALVAR
jgi:hypothetical protein